MSLDPVMAYFERMEEDLLPVDKIETIKECVKEFKQERDKFGGPIVEKKYIIPSKDQEETKVAPKFKVNVVS